MQTQIQCSSCGIQLTVQQSSVSSVYACPSCSNHFEVGPAPAPEPMPKKPMLVTPLMNPAPIPSLGPAISRPGLPSYNPTTLGQKSTDKTVLLLVASVVLLCIVCVSLVVINSKKSEPVQAAIAPVKPTQTDIRKGIAEKAQDMLESSADSVERAVEEAEKKQQALNEEQEQERALIGEMYGDKYFSGDHKAGYQLIVEIEGVLNMSPESQEQAKDFLLERMKLNPVLKPHIAKIDELPFSEDSKGPASYLKQYKSFGTGFFVAADGWIVSNRHVVGDAKSVDVRMSDGSTHRAKVVKKHDDMDLALIKVEVKAPKCLPVSKGATELGLGRSVFTIGFPNPVLQGIEPKYTDGKVSATAGLSDDKNFYQVSVPVQPGNSGGALVDAETGWVVGVITLRLENTMDGRSAQNVSYAIKSAALHEFVESFNKSGSDEIKLTSSKASSPNGVIDMAKDSAVQILVPRDRNKGDQE